MGNIRRYIDFLLRLVKTCALAMEGSNHYVDRLFRLIEMCAIVAAITVAIGVYLAKWTLLIAALLALLASIFGLSLFFDLSDKLHMESSIWAKLVNVMEKSSFGRIIKDLMVVMLVLFVIVIVAIVILVILISLPNHEYAVDLPIPSRK